MTCVRSSMIYGSETWAMNAEQLQRLDRTEMRMVRWMCGVSLRERETSNALRQRIGIEAVGDVVKRGRLRWLGHVLRKEDDDWVKKCMLYEVDGRRERGRPSLTWWHLVEIYMRGMTKEDAVDQGRWTKLSW